MSDVGPVLVDFLAYRPTYHLTYAERISHDGVSVSKCIMPPNAGTAIGASQFTIAVFDGEPSEIEWRLPPGMGRQRRIFRRNMANINRANHPFYQRWSGMPRVLVIALDRAFLEPIIEEAFPSHHMPFEPVIGVQDPDIASIAEGWRKELSEGGPGGRLYAESLATVTALHVYRTYSERSAHFPSIKGGLSPVRLNRVVDYMNAHLDEEISLRKLARVAQASPGHFGEQFKVSTGKTPFRFLLERRIGRAKELLLSRNMTLAEVALEVGFANQSHFTVNFRKLTGQTPARFRKEFF